MFFFLALLLSTCLSVAADWSDFATEPSQVQADGKSFYEISSAGELAWFSKQVASGKNDINAILRNDIVLWDSVSGDTNYWSPIGPTDSLAFEGVFNGNGKTISGAHSEYSLENVDSVFNGFFRFVGENGVVKNLTLEKSVILVEFLGSDTVMTLETFSKYTPFFYSVVGCVVGENRGLVDSVRVIDGEALAKGNTSTRVVSTTTTSMVNAYIVRYFVGGVAGLNRGTVTHAYVNGMAVPSHGLMVTMYMGGIVGANVGTVSESRVEGDLKDDGPSMLGGICGKNEGSLDHVKVEGDLETVTGFVAGIVAENHGLAEWTEYTGSLGRAGDGGVTIGGIAAYNLGKISKSFYGFVEDSKTLRLTANLTAPSGIEISPTAYAGGIVARQSNEGIVEDCGVRVSWIVLGTKTSKSGGMYTGGLVGIDSGSVYNSYAAFYKISSVGNKAPLYNVITGGAHEGNHYDSVMMETPFPRDTTGLEQSLMKSPKFAWMLNTKYQTVANRNIWCHNGSFPVLALDGREPTYGIVRYVNDMVFDTVYTDCDGHAVWGDSIPDPSTGKMIGGWKLKNGTDVGPQFVFSRDTSIYVSVENGAGLFFTVTFKDYNDTVLSVLKNVAYGKTPVYPEAEPFRDSAELKYRYVFMGWTPEISPAVEDRTYKAVYDSTIRNYKVALEVTYASGAKRWSYVDAYYGQVGIDCGEDPTKGSDDEFDYVFKAWSLDCKTLVVKSDTTLYAIFTPKKKNAEGESSSSVAKSSSSSAKSNSAKSSSATSSSAKSSSAKSSSGKSSSSTDQIHMAAAQVMLKYSVERGWIYLDGLTSAAPVALFDIQGNLVKRETPSESHLAILLERRGMYILKYKGTSFKVFVP